MAVDLAKPGSSRSRRGDPDPSRPRPWTWFGAWPWTKGGDATRRRRLEDEDGSFRAKLSETFSFKMHSLFMEVENYPLCHINTPRW